MAISKESKAAYDREYYQLNRACKDAASKAYIQAKPDRRSQYIAVYKWRIKYEAFSHYGASCACCGESTPHFLSIDHVNGGGNKHRKELKGTSIYAWLKRAGYPEGFQTLCFNCNLAKGFHGECPHKHRDDRWSASPLLTQ